jgi:hypothetical protein
LTAGDLDEQIRIMTKSYLPREQLHEALQQGLAAAERVPRDEAPAAAARAAAEAIIGMMNARSGSQADSDDADPLTP